METDEKKSREERDCHCLGPAAISALESDQSTGLSTHSDLLNLCQFGSSCQSQRAFHPPTVGAHTADRQKVNQITGYHTVSEEIIHKTPI